MKYMRMAIKLYLLMLITGSANALLIDDFDDEQLAETTATEMVSNSIVPGSFIGDSREFITNVTSNPNNNTTTLSASDMSILNFAKGPNTIATGEVIWRGTNLDLTESNTQNEFEFVILENNATFADIIFTAFDGINTGIFQMNDIDFIFSGVSTTYTIAYADFSGMVDFSSINSLSLFIDGSDAGNGVDMQFDFISTRVINVPPSSITAPSVLGLFSLGLFSLMLRKSKT